MKFEEFKRRKKEGSLPRIKIPSNGFARVDGYILTTIIIILIMHILEYGL